jgi:hypothetical protein
VASTMIWLGSAQRSSGIDLDDLHDHHCVTGVDVHHLALAKPRVLTLCQRCAFSGFGRIASTFDSAQTEAFARSKIAAHVVGIYNPRA